MTRDLVDAGALIAAVEARSGGKPLDAITTAVALAEKLSDAGDAVIEHFVKVGREVGMSWTQIAT